MQTAEGALLPRIFHPQYPHLRGRQKQGFRVEIVHNTVESGSAGDCEPYPLRSPAGPVNRTVRRSTQAERADPGCPANFTPRIVLPGRGCLESANKSAKALRLERLWVQMVPQILNRALSLRVDLTYCRC